MPFEWDKVSKRKSKEYLCLQSINMSCMSVGKEKKRSAYVILYYQTLTVNFENEELRKTQNLGGQLNYQGSTSIITITNLIYV